MTASVPDTGGHSSRAARQEEARSKKDAVLSMRPVWPARRGRKIECGCHRSKGKAGSAAQQHSASTDWSEKEQCIDGGQQERRDQEGFLSPQHHSDKWHQDLKGQERRDTA